MTGTLIPLIPTEQPLRFRLDVVDGLCVGPPGNVFLFGGIGLAAAVAAMKRVVGREPVFAAVQFASFARIGSLLDLEVAISATGRNISQASVVARVGEETIFTASGAFGDRLGQPVHQWIAMPDVPTPEDCVEAPIWPRQGAGFNERLAVRFASGSLGTRVRDGSIDGAGRLQFWARPVEDVPLDETLLTILGDFLPAGVGSALGRWGGGNSLDNTVRFRAMVPTRWIFCDIQIAAVDRGFGHGEVRLFAEDGTLMAVASQSLILRFPDQ